jgi:hypothetical protein
MVPRETLQPNVAEERDSTKIKGSEGRMKSRKKLRARQGNS